MEDKMHSGMAANQAVRIPYKAHAVELSKNTQKEDWFLEINPNGRIPALQDIFTDGNKIRLFESGSIMQYLVARYDHDHKISFSPGTREFYEMNNWLFFQNASVGPMQGQANHFTRYSPETIQYGINRYQNETRRLYGVLEKHLKDGNKEYLVGNKCTIADIAHYGWIASAGWAGIEIDDFPTLKAWEERMEKRPGVSKGQDIPVPFGKLSKPLSFGLASSRSLQNSKR
jgi:glutathione S-transferase